MLCQCLDLVGFLFLDLGFCYRRRNIHGCRLERFGIILSISRIPYCPERHTSIKKPLSLASPTIVLHRSSPLSSVLAFPMTNKELLARVSATFIRLASFKKPMVGDDPDRTVERMMISFSCPWKPSTVLNLKSAFITYNR